MRQEAKQYRDEKRKCRKENVDFDKVAACGLLESFADNALLPVNQTENYPEAIWNYLHETTGVDVRDDVS